jgi:asparagine synthase (glutamine-hydrolysing)
MCGIAGFILSDGHDHAEDVLRRMIISLKHRGPDGYGIWIDSTKRVGLAHSRLSIVDLSAAGSQPMISQNFRFTLIFNGEIYNHNALRRLLATSGFSFEWRGNSDTETILNCFTAFGFESTLNLIVGMFAIALWDNQKKTLSLVRDRLGEKPLYWGWQGGSLIFGSELKALKAHPHFEGEIDRNALALLLRHNYIPSPYSIYKGIRKLQAGHFVTIPLSAGSADVQSSKYWQINDVLQRALTDPFRGSDEKTIDALEAQLEESIKLQMLADVPLGAFLSGGVDSSTVVALMQKNSGQRVRSFAIGFEDPEYNEAEHARNVAQHLGTDHTELYIGAREAIAVIPSLASIYCEPFADSSQIPTYMVSHLAREHVTVALSGDGGDEIFGGYNSYLFMPGLWKRLAWLPLSVRSAIQSVLLHLPLPDRLAKFREVMAARTPQDLYRQILSHWSNPEGLVLGAHEPTTLLNTPKAWPAVDSFEHWMMAMDAQTYMVDDVLTKVDRAAMANSLETRVPLLDHRVVELAWRMPLNMKIRNGQGKWVLRQVLYRHVPKEMIERPKKGFSIPLAAWLRGPLRDWAEALLDEKRLKSEGYMNSRTIRKIWLEHLENKFDHSSRLWGVLMFQAWLEENQRA